MQHFRWKFSKKALTFFTFLVLFFSLTPALTYADVKSDLQGGVGAAAGTPSRSAETNVSDIISTVINILTVVVGIVAVIMIIVAGFRYITSGGKQESVTGAKNTILYAIIGLIVVALAQIIVHFVVKKTITATTPQCVNHKWDSGADVNKPC